MERRSTYVIANMTEKKYLEVLEFSFGLGIANRLDVLSRLGLRSAKTKSQLLMARVLEGIRSLPAVGYDFKENKLRERKQLNEINLLRSVRFLNGLPCRGQRTQTNGGTAKRRVGKKNSPSLMRKRTGNSRLRMLSRRTSSEGRMAVGRGFGRMGFFVGKRNVISYTRLSRFSSARIYRRLLKAFFLKQTTPGCGMRRLMQRSIKRRQFLQTISSLLSGQSSLNHCDNLSVSFSNKLVINAPRIKNILKYK